MEKINIAAFEKAIMAEVEDVRQRNLARQKGEENENPLHDLLVNEALLRFVGAGFQTGTENGFSLEEAAYFTFLHGVGIGIRYQEMVIKERIDLIRAQGFHAPTLDTIQHDLLSRRVEGEK